LIVQIYEIQTPREAAACIDLGVDRIGSVLLSEKDWKQPEIREVIRVSEGTKTRNSLIPLFNTRDTLYRAMEHYRPHFVHFCESLMDSSGQVQDLHPFIDLQREFKRRFPDIGVVRTVPIPEQGRTSEVPLFEIVKIFEPVTDVFLIDTWLGKEPVQGFIGITGKMADRDLAKDLVLRSTIPVLLAGGLSPDNVRDALVHVTPAGADSCSHTNAVDTFGVPVRFKKDFAKVKRFVHEVRRAEQEFQVLRKDLEKELHRLRIELQDRQAALPAHSVRPHQILAIEELEEKMALALRQLEALRQSDRPS
jgi:phosphoribosylanthranilate isomerase